MTEEQQPTGGPAQERSGWFDRKENASKALRAFYIVCAVVLLADLVARNKPETDIDAIPFFYGVFAFAGSLALIWLAKAVLRRAVMRSEDYYDD